MSRFSILIVDDEDEVRDRLTRVLSNEFHAEGARDGRMALKALESAAFDVVLLDQIMPGMSGLEVLREIKRDHPEIDVIMVTAVEDRGVVVECIKNGAEDFVNKPIGIPGLKQKIRGLLKRRRLQRENQRLRSELDRQARFEEMVGESPAFVKVLEAIRKGAPIPRPVIVFGESGTGKELVARAVHANSPRRDNAFLAVNCGAFSDELLASELFGHAKGAFTGARESKRGLFEAAEGGTLFLDEIGETSPSFQVQLLRVLENGEILPVGSTTPRKVDARIVAATNRKLEKEIARGKFRQDLYYRLWQFPILVPPLRERKDDIPLLANHFLALYSQEFNKRVQGFSERAMAALTRYSWPGNVRELKTAVERGAIYADGTEVLLEDLAFQSEWQAVPAETTALFEGQWRDAKRRFERNYIIAALRGSKSNISEAARRSGMDRKNFRKKMQHHGITLGNLND